MVASSNRVVYISPFILHLSSSSLLFPITHNVTIQSIAFGYLSPESFVIDSTKSVSIYICSLWISLTDPLHFNKTFLTCPSPPSPRHQPSPSSSCAFRQDETAVEPRSSANLGLRPTPPAHDAECVGSWDGGSRDRARGGARDRVRDTVRCREARSKEEASQERRPQEGQFRSQTSQSFITNSYF